MFFIKSQLTRISDSYHIPGSTFRIIMFSSFFTCSSFLDTSRKKKNSTTNRDQNLETKKVELEVDPQVLYFNGNPFGSGKHIKLSLWSDNHSSNYFQNNSRSKEVKVRNKAERARAGRFPKFLLSPSSSDHGVGGEEEEDKVEEEVVRGVEIIIMKEVFDAVLEMKNAYVRLQESHSPFNPEKLRAAELAVVRELRKLGGLREMYLRRRCHGSDDLLVEVVAPYEAAVEELRREVKARDMEIEQLKEKLKSIVSVTNNCKKIRPLSRRKVFCSPVTVLDSPVEELFEGTVKLVREASQFFTSILLSHMRAAEWDIAAAVRSIEAATTTATMISTSSVIQTQHANAKYALQSYITKKIFQGFDHESFHIDGSTSSLLNPEKYRQDCFTQYNDMKSMDALELLDMLPKCSFGKFCCNKYLAIVHPKMEASLFGDLEQRRYVVEGSHPRSQFYREFLKLGKAVWLLHLLAFSLDPAPSLFEASRGSQFHPQYMESVVTFQGGRVPPGQVVGFPMSPGFKLGNVSIIKAEVYPVSRN